MSTSAISISKPAILGGKPVFESSLRFPWPITDDATAQAMAELYRTGWWSWNGYWEQKSADLLAQIHTARYGMLMVNGTVTLEAALHVFGIGPGDEVIVPAFTWLATAMAVLYVGATPVFVDVEPGTLCLDPVKVAEAITPRTRAIIPVHLYGGMTDMDAIMLLAHKHGLKVIEDCAHAHGGMWDGQGLGSIGDVGSFSFQQSKTISSGEGGGLITNDEETWDRLFRFKHIGYPPGSRQGEGKQTPPAGLVCRNYRATEFQGLAVFPQLEQLEALTLRRNANADILTRLLEKIPGLVVQKRGRKATAGRQSYYGFIIQYDPQIWGGISLARLQEAIRAEGIPVEGTYGTVYRHPLWNIAPEHYRIHGDWRDESGVSCQVSEEIATERSICLKHFFLDLPEGDLQKIAEAFHKIHSHVSSLIS